jgi:hypothetical protein
MLRTTLDMPSCTFIVDHPGCLRDAAALCELVTAIWNSIGEKPGRSKTYAQDIREAGRLGRLAYSGSF